MFLLCMNTRFYNKLLKGIIPLGTSAIVILDGWSKSSPGTVDCGSFHIHGKHQAAEYNLPHLVIHLRSLD